MTQNIVEMMKAKGYVESQDTEKFHECEHVVLTKSYKKEVSRYSITLKVEVFVNLSSGICHAEFWNGGRKPFKSRWYDTIGKRTFNAISDTVRNAGFAI